jgi:hypothetical protein
MKTSKKFKNLSVAQKVIQWFQDNPGAKVSNVAVRFNISIPYAYKLREKAAGKAEKPAPQAVAVAEASVSYDDLATKYTENLARSAVQAAQVTVDTILDSRATDYGTFRDNSRLAQALKRAMAEHAEDQGKTFADDQWEALEMIASKMSRIVNGDPNKADSWDDIAGYAKLVSDRIRGVVR